MSKTLDQYFIDWEAGAFGYGYGSGEEHVLRALKRFTEILEPSNSYDYRNLEAILSPPVAWLLINRLCQVDVIEYGTSPRFGWLTRQGEALKAYIGAKTTEQLVNIVCEPTDPIICSSDSCNCDGQTCSNPFWRPTRVDRRAFPCD